MSSRIPFIFAAIAGAALLSTDPALAQQGGAAMFAQNCSACHQLTGKGILGAFPALAGNPFVIGPPKPVVLTVLNGRGGMPKFRGDLSDAQIATILTFVRASWGNQATAITPAFVASVRGSTGAPQAGAALQAH